MSNAARNWVKALRLGWPFATTAAVSGALGALIASMPLYTAILAGLVGGGLGAAALWRFRRMRPVRAGLIGMAVAAACYVVVLPVALIAMVIAGEQPDNDVLDALGLSGFLVVMGFMMTFWFTLPLGFLSGFLAQRGRSAWDVEPVEVHF